MTSKVEPQIALEEQVIEDSDLEAALEEREKLKAASKLYRAADKKAKKMLPTIADGQRFRCGRFVINGKKVEGQEVEFERKEGVRITIKADTPF